MTPSDSREVGLVQVAKCNGIHLHHHLRRGPDPVTLVFVNSLGTDFRLWDRVVSHLPDTWNLLLYDKRGHGLSEAPAPPYSIEDHAADLAALLETLKIGRAVVCGISVGGMIALSLAARRPELVERLVVMDSGHRIGTADTWNERIATVEERGIEALADGILQRWFSERFHREWPEELVGWRNMLTRTPVDGYVGTCCALREADLTGELRKIRAPALCICGEKDQPTPPALMRELDGLIADSRYREIPGAGHLPCVDEADTVSELITSFVEGHPL